jgi:acyl dehydratase
VPIDLSRALGAELGTAQTAWDADDVILYHLGLGAGAGRAVDPRELEYTYERHLKVLPSFGVIPVGGVMRGLVGAPGIDVDFTLVLHGEQLLTLHRPIPVAASVETTARIVEIWDKASAALIVVETVTSERGGGPLFTNRFSIFARVAGGFGGEPGPRPRNQPPQRDPDLVVSAATADQQALLYRLNGDKNPLHADPELAARAGFERPILHGLCTYGIVCKSVVDAALDGDVERVASYEARFSGVVFPGQTIVTSMWREDGSILLTAGSGKTGSNVLANAKITLR